jgi:HlyD family secretion protein
MCYPSHLKADERLETDAIFAGRVALYGPQHRDRGETAIPSRKRLLSGALVLGVAGLTVFLWALTQPDTLTAFGTIEVHNTGAGSKVGGRITEVLVSAGDHVRAGDVLVRFDDEELLADLEVARAQLEKLERGYQREEIEAAQAVADSARARLEELRSGYRVEQVAQAQAEVERAQVDAVNAERNYLLAERLAVKGVFSRQQRDDAEAVWQMAVARREVAAHRLAELERGYRSEEVAIARARYREAEAALERMKRGFRTEDIEAARAALRKAEARYRERQVLAPANAVVEVLDVRPGDLISPNTPIVKLLESGQLYVRIYIPETQLGGVRLGQGAVVRLDALPGEMFAGEVEQINQKAEFLPRNVQTQAERIHQVFGVKVKLNDPNHRLRPGMVAKVVLEED